MRLVEVVRTYLQLLAPEQLSAVPLSAEGAHVVRRAPCSLERYRALYRTVGERWNWNDRLAWSDDQLTAHLEAPAIGVWELLVDGASGGFFELRRHEDGSVEIAYFGLAPRFIGQGLGGALLSRAVTEAWLMDATRVWLHTCTLDSPRALPNYRARGFREYQQERYTVELTDDAV